MNRGSATRLGKRVAQLDGEASEEFGNQRKESVSPPMNCHLGSDCASSRSGITIARTSYLSSVSRYRLVVFLLLVVLAAVAMPGQSALASAAISAHLPTNSPVQIDQAEAGFVFANGQDLYLNGRKLTSYGATIYPHVYLNGSLHYGSAWAYPTFTQYLDTILTTATAAHLNTLRATNYLDGTSNPYDSTVWANMDYLLSRAASHNVFVILDLSPFRNYLIRQGRMPYDASRWTDFLDFVGARYSTNPSLLEYSIAGEVSCPSGKDPLRPPSTAALTQFYSSASSKLFSADQGHHLISSGGFLFLNNSGCGIDWKSIFALSHINVSAIHVYSDNDRYITMPKVSSWSVSHRKPFVVEEFGFQQRNGDASRSSQFQDMYARSFHDNAACVIFWNLGFEVKAASYDVNVDTPATWSTVLQNAP